MKGNTMKEHDVNDKNSLYNKFIWDDDPFPVWTAGLSDLIWPESEEGVLQSGLCEMDKTLGGLREGSLTVVGGKMGCGKSDLAETLVYNLCWRQKTKGMLFAPRKLDGFTLAGLTAIHARLPYDTVIAKGDGTEAVAVKLHDALQDLSALPLVLDDRGGLSLKDIFERVRIAKLQYEIEFVVIDKWQNYSNPFRFDDTALCFLKELARRFSIPVVLFTRIAKSGTRRLTTADVDDSGFLDQPDAVILMHNDDRNGIGELELEVVKNRYGGLGSVRAAYIPDHHWIVNLAM